MPWLVTAQHQRATSYLDFATCRAGRPGSSCSRQWLMSGARSGSTLTTCTSRTENTTTWGPVCAHAQRWLVIYAALASAQPSACADAQSKLCNLLFVKELANPTRLQGANILVLAVHPGESGGLAPGTLHHCTVVRQHLERCAGLILTSIWSTKWAADGFVAKTIGYVAAHWIKSIEEVQPEDVYRSCPEFECCLTAISGMQGAATTVFAVVDEGFAAHQGAYLVDCKVHKPHKAALDADLAARLWRTTELQLQQAA